MVRTLKVGLGSLHEPLVWPPASWRAAWGFPEVEG